MFEEQNQQKIKQLKSAVRTARFIRNFCTIFTIISTVIVFIWLLLRGRYQYIFYSASSLPIRLGAIIFPVAILYRTVGPLCQLLQLCVSSAECATL